MRKLVIIIKRLRSLYRWAKIAFPNDSEFGYKGKNAKVMYPLRIVSPKGFYIEENARLSPRAYILNAPNEKVIIKKYTVVAANCTIVTNNHRSTVGIPQILLGASHVNDKSQDVIIDEDVWIGSGVTILAGVHIGRGAIIGAGSIVSKSIPPYAVAVGTPARIVKKNFSVDQILIHESKLYPKNERFSREQLEENDRKYFKGLQVFGTSEGLDSDAMELIDKAKRLYKFIEPQID